MARPTLVLASNKLGRSQVSMFLLPEDVGLCLPRKARKGSKASKASKESGGVATAPVAGVASKDGGRRLPTEDPKPEHTTSFAEDAPHMFEMLL